jgi:hypothetical protein
MLRLSITLCSSDLQRLCIHSHWNCKLCVRPAPPPPHIHLLVQPTCCNVMLRRTISLCSSGLQRVWRHCCNNCQQYQDLCAPQPCTPPTHSMGPHAAASCWASSSVMQQWLAAPVPAPSRQCYEWCVPRYTCNPPAAASCCGVPSVCAAVVCSACAAPPRQFHNLRMVPPSTSTPLHLHHTTHHTPTAYLLQRHGGPPHQLDSSGWQRLCLHPLGSATSGASPGTPVTHLLQCHVAAFHQFVQQWFAAPAPPVP